MRTGGGWFLMWGFIFLIIKGILGRVPQIPLPGRKMRHPDGAAAMAPAKSEPEAGGFEGRARAAHLVG